MENIMSTEFHRFCRGAYTDWVREGFTPRSHDWQDYLFISREFVIKEVDGEKVFVPTGAASEQEMKSIISRLEKQGLLVGKDEWKKYLYGCEGDISEWTSRGFLPIQGDSSGNVLVSDHLIVREVDGYWCLTENNGAFMTDPVVKDLIHDLKKNGLIFPLTHHLLIVPKGTRGTGQAPLTGPFDSFLEYLLAFSVKDDNNTLFVNGPEGETIVRRLIKTAHLRISAQVVSEELVSEVKVGKYDVVHDLASLVGYTDGDEMFEMEQIYATGKVRRPLPLEKVTPDVYDERFYNLFVNDKIWETRQSMDILEDFITGEPLIEDTGLIYRTYSDERIVEIVKEKGTDLTMEDLLHEYHIPKLDREDWHEDEVSSNEVFFYEELLEQPQKIGDDWLFGSLDVAKQHVTSVLEGHVNRMREELDTMMDTFGRLTD